MKLLGALVDSLLAGMRVPILVLLFGFGPLFIVGCILHRRKSRYKEQASEPFTKLPLRPPGESLRIKIEELTEVYDEALLSLFVASVGAVVLTVSAQPSQQLFVGLVSGIFAIISYGRWVPRVYKTARQLWDCRLGYMGERVVGEELNQLLAHGFRVFHDVPFDSFNIDHVLVGPAGVYVVETKSRRKPARITGPDKATIVFDGATLHFPNGSDARPLQQTLLNAKTLSDHLSSVLAERIPVKGILTYPGWWIERKAKGEVNVLNPEEIKHSFTKPKEPLTEKQIQQIAHWLTEKCRMTKE